MQSKADVHLQRAYELLRMTGRRKRENRLHRQNFGVKSTKNDPITVSDEDEEPSPPPKRPRVSEMDTPKKILDKLLEIVETKRQQNDAIEKIGNAMSTTNDFNLWNKMLACIEFLTCNMYCDIMHRLFLKEIETVVPGPPKLVELQDLANDFARVLQFLKKEEYSRYAEDVRAAYEQEVREIRRRSYQIHHDMLILVKKGKAYRSLREMLDENNVGIVTFADLYSEYQEQLRQVLTSIQELNDQGFDTSENPVKIRDRDNEHISKILGCLEILSLPKHSANVIAFAHEHLLPNTDPCLLLRHMQGIASKYLDALKGAECYTYTLAKSYEDTISSINQIAKHIHSSFIEEEKTLAEKVFSEDTDITVKQFKPKMIAELMQERQGRHSLSDVQDGAVASSSSSGRHRSPSPLRQHAAASSSDAQIKVYWDQGTEQHKWMVARDVQNDDGTITSVEDGRIVHQEKKDRVKWALEAFKKSRVKYDIKELHYSHRDREIPRYLLEIQNYYCGTSLDALPQIAELAEDTKDIGRNPDGWPTNVNGSMFSVFSSGNLIRNVVEEVQTNDSIPKRLRFVLTRPPGHHAHFDASKNPMNRAYKSGEKQIDRHTHGFCIFNNALVMTHDFTQKGYCVLLIDIDFHKGDGTPHVVEQMNNDTRTKRCVEHVDVYCSYAFPNLNTSPTHCQCIGANGSNCDDTHSHFHGMASEDFGPQRQASLRLLVNMQMNKLLRKKQPLIVIVQFGVDAHIKDAVVRPQANPFIEPSRNWFEDASKRQMAEYTPARTRDYYELGQALARFRRDHERKFSVVCLLEGGYARESLQCSIAGFLQGWSLEELSADLRAAPCGGDQYQKLKHGRKIVI